MTAAWRRLLGDPPAVLALIVVITFVLAALLADAPDLFRVAAAAMLIGSCGIVLQLVRTRRLADVTERLRFPEGVRRPRLFVAEPKRT